MSKIKEILPLRKLIGIPDYILLYGELEETIKKIKITDEKKIKIALLSSFTIKGMKETLFVKCCGINIVPEIYAADYNQYNQEILNTNSGLYAFKPDLITLFMDTMAILGENYFLPYSVSDEERKFLVDDKINEMKALIGKIKENSDAKILIHNFEVPSYSPLGILENKQKFGFIESIEALNAGLKNAFKEDSRVFIFDYDAFCSKIGKQHIIDYKLYYLADIKLNLQHISPLCEEYLAYIKPLMSLAKKCIVLDLDNTLWGGVIGEDGLEGIKLGHTPEGRPFLEFQKHLLSLFNRGVILAINSKNNPNDALEVFRKYPNMVLKEKHFAAMQINWNDKISNMKAIAEELNIGIDSMVFIDDDKLNREMVSKALPEVLVIEMPEDPSLYSKTLMEINEFNTLQITEEDREKGRMYAEQRNRSELQKSSIDITEYLKNLGMVVTVQKASSLNIPRISQLTQKTNQFNMTTRRYMEEDIKRLANDRNHLVVSIRVEDKFGDNGITGTAIVEKGKDKWRIDTFLLSCRVIGRRVEETLLAYILKEAKKENAKKIMGEFVSTKKNDIARNFYKDNEFNMVKKSNETEVWEYDLTKEYKFPDFIRVIEA